MWIDDDIIRKMQRDLYIQCWVPNQSYVVLGAGNNPETEANLEECRKDQVPILRRYGGGGAVVLHEGCLVIGLGAWVKNPYSNAEYFRILNSAIIECLRNMHSNFENLDQKGISDICLFDRKIAGTSLFRSKHYLLYQASLLVDLKLEKIEKYLKHPTREPEYRKTRGHGEFLTCIGDILGGSKVVDDLREFFEARLEGISRALLGSHLIEPQQNDFLSLQSRLERAQEISKTHGDHLCVAR